MFPPRTSLDLRLLRERVVTHFWLKTIGTTVFISLFFVAYFRVLNFPIFPVTVMPLTVLDAWTPFIPLTLILYLSLWAYVPLAPLLQPEKTSLYAVGWEAGGVALVGLGIFIFHPTAVPVPAIDWSQHPGFGFLKTVDASGNACPSLHVAFAVFAAIRVQAVLRDTRSRASLHVMNWAWCVAIAYSTLATKQHVAVDVFAGAALGVAGGMVRWATPLVCRLRGVSAI